ncbi:hypothetical protein PG985_006846 [Apiospora marii]|uniref:uncharacterized protein n=1 Tax=Apiospora marii TaxID=335849 RepID=UPI0031302EF0
MLLGVCGSKCAGKSTVAQYLVEHHGFQRLHLSPAQAPNGTASSSPEPPEESALPDVLQDAGSIGQLAIRGKPSSPPARSFTSATDLLDFVTKYWRSRWVTTDIHDETVLDILCRRPFFILVSVDAPIVIRWRRYQARNSSSSSSNAASSASATPPTASSLEEFIAESDDHLYSGSLAHLYATLGKLDLTNPERLRPSWDNYFMSLASLAAQRSNCMKRAVGCVLVGRERRVISTGYNGTPRGIRNCGEGGCARCNAGMGSGAALATCLCLHAEENALLEAGRERIRDGSVLYCNTCPCLTCSIKIVQVGISEVVYSQGYSMDGETAEVFRSAGIKLRQFSPPANGLIHLEKMDLY